jgi:16S rRNA (cytidine1402-2'-O)-methyltransferase
LIVYEAAPRVAATLADMAEILGPRTAAVARELTKLHEAVQRGRLDDLARHYRETGPPRGEIVVVVAPPEAAAPPGETEIDARLGAVIAEAGVREAALRVAAETGLPRRTLYRRALALRGKDR